MFLRSLISKRRQIFGTLPFLVSYPFSSFKAQENKNDHEKDLQNLWNDEDLGKDWYSKGNQYWNDCESTYNGVMGGYGHLNDIDIKFSRLFMDMLKEYSSELDLKFDRVLDCGAGIGRVSKELLVKLFKKVDLLEQCDKYIDEAKQQLNNNPNVEDFYTFGMQEFEFKKQYDCVWIQWVSNQIRDDDYIKFLQKCSNSLSSNGMIIVKENISEEGFILDAQDYSITRSDSMYKALFQKANLQIILERKQPEFPDELFDIKMYALKKIMEANDTQSKI